MGTVQLTGQRSQVRGTDAGRRRSGDLGESTESTAVGVHFYRIDPGPSDTSDINGFEYDGSTQFMLLNFAEALAALNGHG
jgi:hypothetical protein